jgi:hypothetical protein
VSRGVFAIAAATVTGRVPRRLFRMVYELAERRQNGLIVRLLWDSLRDAVILRYRDRASDDAFVTEVPRTQALVAFKHPNAYRPLASA